MRVVVAGGQVAEERRRGWLAPDLVVAKREDEQRRRAFDPAAEVLERVERRLVRPVDVFEHRDRRLRRGAPRGARRSSVVTLGVRGRRLGREAVEALDDVVHGPERPRREQRLAGAPDDADLVLVPCRERADERRLADAGLAAHEDDAPGAETRALEVGVELGAAPRPVRAGGRRDATAATNGSCARQRFFASATALGSAVVAVTEVNPNLGADIVADAKEYVLYSWSTQDAINPIAVAGAEGRYFWDYDGKRYLDFASQLVNVNIGHQHPKIIAAIKEQADRLCTIGPPMASESRSRLGRLLDGGHARRPLHVVLHELGRGGERERDQARAARDRAPQDHRALPLVPRRDARLDRAHGRSEAVAERARAWAASCGCSTRTRIAVPRAIPIRARSALERRTSRRSSSTRERTPSRP